MAFRLSLLHFHNILKVRLWIICGGCCSKLSIYTCSTVIEKPTLATVIPVWTLLPCFVNVRTLASVW